MAKQNIGGDRLGSGAGTQVETKHFSRSSHDMGYIWKSSMASGTLVPFMVEPILPGSSMDIDLETVVMTQPTIGPLFGSYKIQLDVFLCPIRLYNAHLHMNALNIGLDMKQIKLPQMILSAEGDKYDENGEIEDNSQINPSSLLSYLNIRGVGRGEGTVSREFNALSYLMYWDIYKNYYANKQEEIGVYIHNGTASAYEITSAMLDEPEVNVLMGVTSTVEVTANADTKLVITMDSADNVNPPKAGNLTVRISRTPGRMYERPATEFWDNVTVINNGKQILCQDLKAEYIGQIWVGVTPQKISSETGIVEGKPRLQTFDLKNIDDNRLEILTYQSKIAPFIINGETSKAPYSTINAKNPTKSEWVKEKTQEGLGIKTYQSDLFNNWINTEWIDGESGVNALTAVDTSSGEFTMDSLNMAKKVYEMLNGIAVSGGTFNNWVEVVYDHEGFKSYETPVYLGGLIRELTFEEVVSNAGTDDQALGTLAGRGQMTQKKKGGKINVRVDEPSYVIGIISLTPRIDYSQGTKWDNNLKTMDDFHKPHLDEIGFQDLITDQMHWADTEIIDGEVKYKSAGKVPAWINYMTNVNQVRGTFAEKKQQMFMTLDRRYTVNDEGIEDLTSYIDPSKFNHIFADTRLDAENFWVQIKIDNIARRKMSAKVMPNL